MMCYQKTSFLNPWCLGFWVQSPNKKINKNMNYDVNLDFVLFSQRLHFLSKQKSISGTVFHIFFFLGTIPPKEPGKDIHTSWYFLVTLLGTHWHSLQVCMQQAQFPPQRLTRRQPGQKMVSVLFSSSLIDTEKFLGVQLYSLTSSLRRFRSTTVWNPRKQRKRGVHALSLCISLHFFS